MKRFVLAFGLLALAAPTAQAQVTGITSAADSVINLPVGPQIPKGRVAVPGAGSITSGPSGASYNSLVTITPQSVSFESDNAVSGPMAKTVSSSSVDLVLTNGADNPVTPVFDSTIIPAGIGFYLADRSSGCGGNIYTGCPKTLSNLTFADLTATGDRRVLASSQFQFSIFSGGVELYHLSGGLDLTYDPTAGIVISQSFGPAATLLNGFGLDTTPGSQSAVGYGWDATDIQVNLLTPLAPGASRTISYRTSVQSTTSIGCINAVTCLTAYAGFGDPIGRGGGIIAPQITAFSLASISSAQGLAFQPAVFNTPSFRNGVLSFKLQGSGVPEPAIWLSLIFGFGVVGTALRRSRRTVRA